PTGASLDTPNVPRKSRSPSAVTTASRSAMPSAVATALSVTPAQAAKASSSMSPEQAASPSPPVAGCRPAATSPLPVSTLQVTPSPMRPWARRVMRAASGAARYFSLSGACSARRSVEFIASSFGCGGWSAPAQLYHCHSRRRGPAAEAQRGCTPLLGGCILSTCARIRPAYAIPYSRSHTYETSEEDLAPSHRPRSQAHRLDRAAALASDCRGVPARPGIALGGGPGGDRGSADRIRGGRGAWRGTEPLLP